MPVAVSIYLAIFARNYQILLKFALVNDYITHLDLNVNPPHRLIH